MSQKIAIKLGLKQMFLICIATIICIATLGLGLGFGFGTGSRNDTPVEALQNENRVLPRGVTQVSGGYNYTVAIDSQGNLWAFGSNRYGQFGDMTNTDSSTPINITAQPGNPLNGKQIIQVSVSGYHTMVIDSSGNLWAFGRNQYGELGNMTASAMNANSTPINITAQVDNPLNGKQIMQVSAGNTHTAAIDSQGNLWVFGWNSHGELGNMSTTRSSTPINITAQPDNPLNGKQIIQVSAGFNNTMAIDASGSLWAFGMGGQGQLGNMSTSNSSTPINITAQPGNSLYGKQIIQASTCYQHTMAIDAQGNLWVFGNNQYGQLGNMSTTRSSTPINITAQPGNPLYGKQIIQVSAGDFYTMVIDAQGNLWTFGNNQYGQLGNMTTSETEANSTPINITAQAGNPLSGKQIIQVLARSMHTMTIDSQGNLWAFGNGGDGQLGNMSTTDSSTPINITAQSGNPLSSSQFGRMQVSAGYLYTMVIDSGGNLWSFGAGGSGRLGNMSTNSSDTPINITAQSGNPLYGKQIVQISAGYNHTMAIDASGNLWSFGAGGSGQLGNMSTTDSSTPINITAQTGNPLNGKQIVHVSTCGSGEGSHTMAIDASGNLWAFGYGSYGQLGNMSTTDSSTPTNITAQAGNPLNGKKIVQVLTGGNHTMAIDASGNLWAFGSGSNGKLGNMSTGNNSTPINITAQAGNPINGKQIVQVSTFGSHTMAIDASGNLWSFGFNYYGQLGNMTTSGSNANSTPINITAQAGNPLYGKQIMQVSVGNIHTAAIDSQGNLWAFGSGSSGKLGNMSTGNNSTPINITAQAGNPLNGKHIISVSAGNDHTMVINGQGDFWAFGSGSNGQLGNISTIATNSTPIKIYIPPRYASVLATIFGSTNARISVRTDFTTGWGTPAASGGTYITWTANSLTAPNIIRNSTATTGRVRYEFDASLADEVTSLSINSTAVSLIDYPTLALWNNILYLRILTNGSILIVEMDRINTEHVTLFAVTSRNVKHSFKFSNNSHLSSRMKIASGSGIEMTSLTHVFDDLTWNNDKATTTSVVFTFTSQAAFTKITIARPSLSDIIITDFTNPIISAAGLTGNLIYNTGTTNTMTIILLGMEQYEYTWTIETLQIIQVQQILNPPAGAISLADPSILTLNSSAGANWADLALASPANQFGKTFAGWYTHPDYTKGTLITTATQLQQHITATGGAIVFLYARWS